MHIKAIQRVYVDRRKRAEQQRIARDAAERAAQIRESEQKAQAEEVERQQAAIKVQKRAQLVEAGETARKLGTMKARADYAKIKRELGFYDE